MPLQLYKENGVPLFPAIKIQKVGESPPSGYTLVEDIIEIDSKYFFDSRFGYKMIRDCLRNIVAEKADPPDVENGFNLLTAAEKAIVAYHNIGTGAQIAATLTDLKVRDQSSIDYLRNMKGNLPGVRFGRSVNAEAVLWSRMKKDLIEIAPSVFVTAPEYIYSKITISDPDPAEGEISGNLLTIYEAVGILGKADGASILGILDYIRSTAGTRFEFLGLGTDPKLSGLVPGGFNNMTEFKNYIDDLIVLGLFELGKTTIA